MNKKAFIKEFYGPISKILSGKKSDFFSFLNSYLLEDEPFSRLKDSLYKMDYWVNQRLQIYLSQETSFKQYGNEMTFMIFGTLRELLFGWLLFSRAYRKYTRHAKNINDDLD